MIKGLRQKLQGSVIATVGFLLSPLSWWNDLYVNIPIAYVCAWLLHFVYRKHFGASMVFFYWLSNLVGLLMLHKGVADIAGKADERRELLRSILVDLALSLVYSAVLAALVYTDVIRLPEEYFKGH